MQNWCLFGRGELWRGGDGYSLRPSGEAVQTGHRDPHLHEGEQDVGWHRLHPARQLAEAARWPAQLANEALGQLGQGLQRGGIRAAEAQLR